jgi:LytS/YehU family sensor histidine kinase
MGNALNSVAALIRTGEHQAAITMLTQLGDLVQDALLDATAVVPLRRELDVVRRYLDIERIRFADRLTVELPTDDAAGDVPIPSFTIQPLVENAMRHGIARQRGPAHIRLSVLPNGNSVSIRIDNSGPPLPAGWTIASHAGVGLGATVERLERMYRGQARLQLESFAGGVRATLTLPRSGPVS